MAKLQSVPSRKSDAESSFRELAESDAPEPQSRPAHERVSEVRISAPSSIEEAVLRAVEELDAFVPIDPPRNIPKA